MTLRAPHFLLFSKSELKSTSRGGDPAGGRWRFALESVDGVDRFTAGDEEPESDPVRLELLAVVRGLEALAQPSRVTLVTASTSVSNGIRFGLPQWRENGWQWESFDRMEPIRNADLWRRVDSALQYHDVSCRVWRFDPAGPPAQGHVDFSEEADEVSPIQDEAEASPLMIRRRRRRWLPRSLTSAAAWLGVVITLTAARIVAES